MTRRPESPDSSSRGQNTNNHKTCVSRAFRWETKRSDSVVSEWLCEQEHPQNPLQCWNSGGQFEDSHLRERHFARLTPVSAKSLQEEGLKPLTFRTPQIDLPELPSSAGCYGEEKLLGMESKLSREGTRRRSSSKELDSSQGISESMASHTLVFLTLHKNNRRGSSVKLQLFKFNLLPSHNLVRLISH